MSQFIRHFVGTVLYQLGYYRERVNKLENKVSELQEKLDLISSTESLYIEKCEHENCEYWWVDGDEMESVRHNHESVWCSYGGEYMCPQHAVMNKWVIDNTGDVLCDKCVTLIIEEDYYGERDNFKCVSYK